MEAIILADLVDFIPERVWLPSVDIDEQSEAIAFGRQFGEWQIVFFESSFDKFFGVVGVHQYPLHSIVQVPPAFVASKVIP